jgi:wyosine [tRNA(Phe)-imidazoG37] synthetase (radical SAM superfamily)
MNPLPVIPLHQSHPRSFESNQFVYPVLSRRAGGLSIGLNLNPNKSCTFACAYCQVDRTQPGGPAMTKADLPQLAGELDAMIELVTSGRIFEGPSFSQAPAAVRRLNDLALSGDGEPTSSTVFNEAVDLCAAARRRHHLDDVKIVLITNATLLHRENVRQALEVLDRNNGEIWGKLDAGTEAYYREIDRSRVPFRLVLDNLHETARVRPIVIQSLFMRVGGLSPTEAEQDAYCDRLGEIASAGGRIKLVQVHTIARPPAESWVTPLVNAEVDVLAERVRQRTGLSVAAFHGAGG